MDTRRCVLCRKFIIAQSCAIQHVGWWDRSCHQGTDSISRKISHSLEGVRSGVKIIESLWNFAGAWAAVLCTDVCQISEQLKWKTDSNNWYHIDSHAFETLQDLTIRRLMWYWIGPQFTGLTVAKQATGLRYTSCIGWALSVLYICG